MSPCQKVWSEHTELYSTFPHLNGFSNYNPRTNVLNKYDSNPNLEIITLVLLDLNWRYNNHLHALQWITDKWTHCATTHTQTHIAELFPAPTETPLLSSVDTEDLSKQLCSHLSSLEQWNEGLILAGPAAQNWKNSSLIQSICGICLFNTCPETLQSSQENIFKRLLVLNC